MRETWTAKKNPAEPKPKRAPRLTQTRLTNQRNVEENIVTLYQRAQQYGEAIELAFERATKRIEDVDLTSGQREQLRAFLWGVRAFLVRTEALWQLYVDGEPMTSTEISMRRAAGDEGIWDRVAGRHVWRSHPHLGFYTNNPPELLSSKETP
jgi:hypothetical protein